jgi:phosphate transport system substrate-binding protein
MTKFKFTSLILILSLLVVACGDSNEASSDIATDDEKSVTQTTVESTNEVSEPAVETLTGEILIDGSSTVFPITQAVAEEFTILNPDVKISVGVSGTGGGFKKFCPGETMISNASRAIKDKEVALCEENNTKYLEVQVGIDALSVVIPSSNDWATCLTVDELNSIWLADSSVSSWNEVRSTFPDVQINLYGPGTDSGTFDFFNEEITGEAGSRSDYTASEDDNVLVNGVSGSEGGLGYFGLAYYEENKDKLNAVQVDAGNGCQSPEAAFEGNYYLARPLYIYISESVKEDQVVKEFVDFYFEAMDIIVPAVGYVPMLEDQKANALSAWQNFSS